MKPTEELEHIFHELLKRADDPNTMILLTRAHYLAVGAGGRMVGFTPRRESSTSRSRGDQHEIPKHIWLRRPCLPDPTDSPRLRLTHNLQTRTTRVAHTRTRPILHMHDLRVVARENTIHSEVNSHRQPKNQSLLSCRPVPIQQAGAVPTTSRHPSRRHQLRMQVCDTDRRRNREAEGLRVISGAFF